MAHSVGFDPEAQQELERLYVYIRDESGSPVVARDYVRRIVEHCLGLADFPLRGTVRNDIRPGLRTMGFERRVTIAFLVEDGTVTVLRILYGGRDLAALSG